MLRLLPARYYEAATTGTRGDPAPQLLSQPVTVAEEDLALLSVGMCLALCMYRPPLRVRNRGTQGAKPETRKLFTPEETRSI